MDSTRVVEACSRHECLPRPQTLWPINSARPDCRRHGGSAKRCADAWELGCSCDDPARRIRGVAAVVTRGLMGGCGRLGWPGRSLIPGIYCRLPQADPAPPCRQMVMARWVFLRLSQSTRTGTLWRETSRMAATRRPGDPTGIHKSFDRPVGQLRPPWILHNPRSTGITGSSECYP